MNLNIFFPDKVLVFYKYKELDAKDLDRIIKGGDSYRFKYKLFSLYSIFAHYKVNGFTLDWFKKVIKFLNNNFIADKFSLKNVSIFMYNRIICFESDSRNFKIELNFNPN